MRTVLADEYVFGFDVAMKNTLVVQILNAFGNLQDDWAGFLLLEIALFEERGLEVARLRKEYPLEQNSRKK